MERRVDQEAKAHEGEGALPPDDTNVKDALDAAKAKVDAGADDADNEAKDLGGERPHHDVADVSESKTEAKPPLDSWMVAPAAEKKADLDSEKTVARQVPSVPPKPVSSIPPPDVPTAQRLEVAQQIADEEEEERTLVGDLSELAKAQELIEAQNKIKEEEKKKGGKG